MLKSIKILLLTLMLSVFVVGSPLESLRIMLANCPVGDLNGDCEVNLPDLRIFTEQWLDADPLAQGLVAHWRLDGSADDPVGGNHGTVHGNPIWTIGQVDGALYFDGVGDYVDCGNDSSLNLINDFSISIWFNLNDAGQALLICKGNVPAYQSGGAYTILCVPTNGILAFYLRGSSDTEYGYATTSVPLNEWTHIVGTFSDGNINIYKNGAFAADGDLGTPAIHTNNGLLGIGAEGDGGLPFKGIIDDVRIYERVLSEVEVGEIAILGHTDPNCADLVGDGNVNLFDFNLLARNWLERWLGSLQVTIFPQEAIEAGAKWRVDGQTWRDSGYIEGDLYVGLHTVDFNAVSGWIEPDEQTVEISKNEIFTTSGIYEEEDKPFFGLYVSEVQVRSDSATGQDVRDRCGVEWDTPREFVENWLVGYLGVNFADIVLYQAGNGVDLQTLMFEVDDIDEDDLVDGTLVGIRGHSMDAWRSGGGPVALLEAAGEHSVTVVFNIQPREMTEDQIVGIISAAFYRFAAYPGFIGMVVDCEFCDTMETGSTWREDELLRARMLRRACAVRDHYEGIHSRDFYIFGVWYRTAYSGARPWHIYFPDVNDLDRLVPMYDGADDNIGSSVDEWLAGGAASPKDFGIEETGHCLFFRKKRDGIWVQLDSDIILSICEASRDAGNEFIEIEYWYHWARTEGWERCYGPEIKDAVASILHDAGG